MAGGGDVDREEGEVGGCSPEEHLALAEGDEVVVCALLRHASVQGGLDDGAGVHLGRGRAWNH